METIVTVMSEGGRVHVCGDGGRWGETIHQNAMHPWTETTQVVTVMGVTKTKCIYTVQYDFWLTYSIQAQAFGCGSPGAY